MRPLAPTDHTPEIGVLVNPYPPKSTGAFCAEMPCFLGVFARFGPNTAESMGILGGGAYRGTLAGAGPTPADPWCP